MLYTDYNSGIAFGYVFMMNHKRFSIFNFMTINKHYFKLMFRCVVYKRKDYLLNAYRKIFGTRSYGGDALASS